MGFKKPFRAVPVKLGTRYLAAERRDRRVIVWRTLAVAALIGAIVGIASEFITP